MRDSLTNVRQLYFQYKNLLKKGNFKKLKDFLSNISNIDVIYEKNIEDRKEKGTFYTKRELADYISRKTLEWYLLKTLNEIRANSFNKINLIENIGNISKDTALQLFNKLIKIKILDPACGSGIFLISIADLLYNLLRKICKKFEIKLNKKNNFQDWELRKEIINNALHGIDVDSSAIQICEMNLIFWLIRDVSKNDLQEIRIENLNIKSNIKNQNALMVKEIEKKFDIILGNPPYGNILNPQEKLQLKEYIFFTNDIYCAFLIQSLKFSKGIIGYLIPKSFLLRQNYLDLRDYLLENSNFVEIIDLGSKIFKGATNEVQIFLYENFNRKNEKRDNETKIKDFSNNVINTYLNHEFDQLKICDQNRNCKLYDKQRRFFAYTFNKTCPFCDQQARNLNRIRIKLDSKKIKIIDYIEKNSDLNYLKIRDFKMVRGEEEAPLKRLRKRIKQKRFLEFKNEYFLINAKQDIEKFKIKKNKAVNLSGFSTKKDILFYKNPKLLIKHNTIYPVTVFVKEKAIFTSSVYSLLGDETHLKALSLLLNSQLMKFYCIYGINNQQDTTINLNQYMIRHLPINLPENVKSFSKIYDVIISLIKFSNSKAEFFIELTDLIIYQTYFKNLKELPDLLDIFNEYIKNYTLKIENLETLSRLKEFIENSNAFKSVKTKTYLNPWIQEINKV